MLFIQFGRLLSRQSKLSFVLRWWQVKYTSTGPCLVEVGSRCHGGEGTWQPIAQECLGYNQVNRLLRETQDLACCPFPGCVRPAGLLFIGTLVFLL